MIHISLSKINLFLTKFQIFILGKLLKKYFSEFQCFANQPKALESLVVAKNRQEKSCETILYNSAFLLCSTS